MTIRLSNVHISGAHTGIKSNGPIDLVAENVTFDNVKVPYDIAGASRASVTGTRIRNDPKPRQTKSGWTKANGPPLPTLCPECKAIFPSRNYNFGGAFFNAWDNEEMCPECGHDGAKLSEGLFDLTGQTVRILSGPDISYAMLRAIAGIADAVVSGQISPDAAVERFEAISPAVGGIARKALSIGKSALLLVSAAAGIVAVYYSDQQTKLAHEQVRLQREANASSDEALSRTLEAISQLKFSQNKVCQISRTPHSGTQGARPDAKARAESRPSRLDLERAAAKARKKRRKIEARR